MWRLTRIIRYDLRRCTAYDPPKSSCALAQAS